MTAFVGMELPATLKVSYHKEEACFALPQDPSYTSIMALIYSAWPELKDKAAEACVKYIDDEGDACTFTEQTFPDFLEVESAKRQVNDKRATVVQMDVTVLAESEATANVLEAHHARCLHGGQCKFAAAVVAMKERGLLTQSMLASILTEWLPNLVEKAAKRDKDNEFVYELKMTLSSAFESVLLGLCQGDCHCPVLEPFQKHIEAMTMSERPEEKSLDAHLLKVLRVLWGLPFVARMRFLELVACHSMSFFANISASSTSNSAVWDHPGVACNGCDMKPIVGPRFSCQTCSGYDLCGNCYPRQDALRWGKYMMQDPFSCQLQSKHCVGKECNRSTGGGTVKGRALKELGKRIMLGLQETVMEGLELMGQGLDRTAPIVHLRAYDSQPGVVELVALNATADMDQGMFGQLKDSTANIHAKVTEKL